LRHRVYASHDSQLFEDPGISRDEFFHSWKARDP
jgi:hypothetical protein